MNDETVNAPVQHPRESKAEMKAGKTHGECEPRSVNTNRGGRTIVVKRV